VIGVAGGAASGKTSVCDMIIQQLHDQRVVLVNQVFIIYKILRVHCILNSSRRINKKKIEMDEINDRDKKDTIKDMEKMEWIFLYILSGD